jgi:putative transcriptional regulator
MNNQVKFMRARFDLTQAELAEKVLVSRQTINAIEAGRFIPTTRLSLKLAVILKTSVEELFTLEPKDWVS